MNPKQQISQSNSRKKDIRSLKSKILKFNFFSYERFFHFFDEILPNFFKVKRAFSNPLLQYLSTV